MRALIHALRALFHADRGATAVEYGLIIAMIVLAMVGALSLFGNTATSMWNNVSQQVQDAGH
ncbi:pilus assembly protein Flp/PilA [Sphingomonas sp. NFR04]|uniref:Flp family type IVb pilin n=1 Tax=Sphingomonas sp. NFR04 TaxID=1566283 RepID=UPI0008E3F53A|nr:Flp family type IVb pilin [Sphingomonas sp. NFR04]SFJ01281.1 pilus assembly protein Flp/PilA [Sphingomonas sp. NFR04]